MADPPSNGNGKNGASAEPPRFDEDAFKKSVQVVPRGQQAFSPTDSFVVYLAQTIDEVEPWGRNVKLRDQQLREFAANEPIFASALATVCARNAAMAWKIEGPEKAAEEAQRILQQANFGMGWQDFSLKFSRDLYTQDNGAFVEIIREANRPDAPVMGIANLDSARCYHTGHPDVPVLYVDRDNKYHYLSWYQVITVAEMPSASEGLRGLQYCAVTRLFRAVKTQRDIGIYLSEKIGGRNPRAVHLLRGVGADEVLAAWQKVGFQNDSAGLTRFSNPVMVSAIAPDVEVDVKTLEIASVPDGFDMAEHWKQYIAQIAMAFLSDYQEFAPLPGGGLGTASQSETQHKKSSRTGIALYRGAIEHFLNWGVFPDDVEMTFEEPDLDAEQAEALARKTRAEERKVRIESQEITAAIARMRALSTDDLTQEEYDEAEKQAEEQAKQQEEAEAAMQEQQAAQLEALNNDQKPPPGQNAARPPRSLDTGGKPQSQRPPGARAPVNQGQAGKAIGVSPSRTAVERKVEEAVTSAFDDLWESIASRVGFEVVEGEDVTEKWNESNWIRNAGRFADFIGRGGGRSGGAGAAKEETGVDTIGGTKVDLSKIADPEIRATTMRHVRDHLDKFPTLQGYVQEVRVEALDSFENQRVRATADGTVSMRLDPGALTPDGLASLRQRGEDGDLSDAFRHDPLRALVSHEMGHAVEDKILDNWRENPARNLDAYMAVERTRTRKVTGRYQEESVQEHFAEAFAEWQTLPPAGRSAGAKAVADLMTTAEVRGWMR